MTSFTEPLRIKKEYLPKETLKSINNLLDSLARGCASKFENCLASNGQRLTPGDYEELVRHLKHEADITLSMSVKITEKKMDEDWMIYPVDFAQTTLDDISPQEERESRVEAVAGLNATLEKRKVAAQAQEAGQ
ncbi:hypothetical protein V7O66_13885 [Methanolobus sp. ZRKC3]|uniref:hypothetical protein n=1 Tax=Methanolobus sp. ZRKC3 TaxID=3125786 RepID=UPI00324F05E6